MAHIHLPTEAPGIRGPLLAYPETAKPLTDLAELLLSRETPAFTRAERELVASYVSFLNGCVFCSESHGAVADHHKDEAGWARAAWADPTSTQRLSARTRLYLQIAAGAQKTPAAVDPNLVTKAREAGAGDREIHDVILITAAFCMYNRYVDGLATSCPPRAHPAYVKMGRQLGEQGYRRG